MKAYIFDLDGTLFDSMNVWEKVDTDFLQKRGIEVPPDYAKAINSMTFLETAAYTIERFNLNDSIESLMLEWNDMAAFSYAHNVQLKKGAKEYITMLYSKGKKLAIATSLSNELLELSLKNQGVYDLFNAICTTEEVRQGKSRPDVYLLAAKKLGIKPCDCLVFEDILPAVKSAKNAGFKVCAVYDKSSGADWEKIKSIADFAILDFQGFSLPPKKCRD